MSQGFYVAEVVYRVKPICHAATLSKWFERANDLHLNPDDHIRFKYEKYWEEKEDRYLRVEISGIFYSRAGITECKYSHNGIPIKPPQF